MRKWVRIRQVPFLISCWLLLTISCGQAAEESDAPVSLFFELLGNGGAYSINADYLLAPAYSVRIGYVTWTAPHLFGGYEELTAFPLLINYLIGRGNHKLETGAGILYGHYKSANSGGELTEDYTFATLTGTLSYRYQRPHGGFFFKAGLTPFYSFANEEKAYPEDEFFPWFGISWGFSF